MSVDDALSRPDTKAGKYQRAGLTLLRQHKREGTIPTNGRFLFYELVQQGTIPKAYYDASGKKRARQPSQDLSDALMRLRELGLVPWEWILDETCSVATWRYAASVHEYVADSVPRAHIDRWRGQLPPLILCESRATAGVLERIASDYLCPITATGGQSGGHIVTEIVPLLRGNDRKVFYIGDCEVGGPADQIEAATRRRIEEHTGRKFTDDTWIRVALTPEQVARSPRLRKLAIDKLDRRYRPPRRYKAIECEDARNASDAPCSPRSPRWREDSGGGDEPLKNQILRSLQELAKGPPASRQPPRCQHPRACSAPIESGDSRWTKDERIYRH
jgi:hypothetical protein